MFFGGFRAAFPDLKQGIKATGKTGSWQEMHIVRMAGGQIKEHWAVVDQIGMLVALGVMPPPGQS